MEEELKAAAFPNEHLHFTMLEQMGATSMVDRARFSPSMTLSVAQDISERALHRVIRSYPDLIEIRWSHEILSLEDDGHGATARFTTPAGERSIRSRFLVGADGSSSITRNVLGIKMIGNAHLGAIINIYFDGWIIAPDAKPQMGLRSQSEHAPGSFISMDGKARWCFHVHYDPREESPDEFTDERCRDIVRMAAGVGPEVDIEVRSVRPWTMTALVAESFSKGNVFLVGDAAHAFPPSGGMGLNSGVQDAHNLAWKLAAVFKEQGGQALLDSYQAERRPVACLNAVQSMRNAITGNLVGLKGTVDASWTSLAPLIADEVKTVRSTAELIEDPEKRRIWEGVEHGGGLGQELGYTYDRSPIVVDDGIARPDIWIARYIPNACPGARAPHIVVTMPDGNQCSTIELFDGKMTMVTWPEGQAWREVLAASHETQIQSVVLGKDWHLDQADFLAQYGLDLTGVIIVRPDGFVAYRASNDGQADGLPAIFQTIYGRIG
jgi:2-polyprenyl-6-methoxyphenol hydroxylase-like FAD-dependent oxidoreductase